MAVQKAQHDLRQLIRAKRQALDSDARQNKSLAATKQAMALLSGQNVKKVASFLSMPEEIETDYLHEAMIEAGYTIYLPKVVELNAPLAWGLYAQKGLPNQRLEKDAVGLLAPVVCMAEVELDVVMMPLVAFDALGNRLGMGGGYYDRTFANKIREKAPLLLGFAYACQQVATLYPNPWDVPLAGIVTELQARWFDVFV